MKYQLALLARALWMAAFCVVAQAQGTPKIQFEPTVYDFGKTSQVATVSGVFKFKNIGDGLLKVEPPKPSCGCTVAQLSSNSLLPGATGELPFTLNLGQSRAVLEKHIAVRSNDPTTPEVSLTIKVDYTPLYELSPITVQLSLGFGTNDAHEFTTLTRTDGKPLVLARLAPSKPWITATVEPGSNSDRTNARIQIAIKRDGPPRRFYESVQLYGVGETNIPIASFNVYGQFIGEVSFSPESMYWSVADGSKPAAGAQDAQMTRRLTIRSVTGQKLDLKKPQSTIKGLKLDLNSVDNGKVYELVARLEEVPASSISGNVSIETSIAAQARIEVPVFINVFKP